MKVGIYGTMRNEAANLDAWLETVADADHVVLNDTGSSDDSVALARSHPNPRLRVEQRPVEPMLLYNALNIACDLLPENVDLAIRLDLDERLQPGWREAIERAGIDGPTVLQPWFDHHGLTYRHDRIHSRHGFRWGLPVHEILVCDSTYTRLPVEVTIEHHQDLTKDRSQVLGELEDAHRADPSDLRMVHYLAREYTYYGRWAEAIPLLRTHANSDAFPEERSESWRLLGDCYVALMDIEDVPRRPYANAARVCPERREGWVALADLHMQQARWFDCVYAAEHALAITEKSWYFNHAWAWNGKAEHLAALACWYLDKYDDALSYGRRAVELDPTNGLYAANLKWYEGAPVSV